MNHVQLGKFGRNRTNVWDYPGPTSLREELKLHPTPKPVALIADVMRDVSARGDIVLDSFSGSGSAIIAAEKTGRRGYAIELDPHYVDVGVRRWEKWSGGVARHLQTGLTFDDLNRARDDAGAHTQVQPLPALGASDPCSAVRVRRRARVA